MATRVRSYSKINLGLRIGPPRPDGFHALCTLYQTLALHDLVTVAAEPARETLLTLECNDPRVPTDARNTVGKMVMAALEATGRTARVRVFLDKRLPVQGGMGAGSANAAAALIALERELGLRLASDPERAGAMRMEMAARVGSDVPLFLVGGAVFGTDRGQVVSPAPDVTLAGSSEIACVMALPGIGVSTPAAFREWDRLCAGPDLHNPPVCDTLEKLSSIYVAALGSFAPGQARKDAAEASRQAASSMDSRSASAPNQAHALQNNPEKTQGAPHAESHGRPFEDGSRTEDPHANTLRALAHAGDGTGLENDFETVVFAQHPSLAGIRHTLAGGQQAGYTAVWAGLSGSGSALFGLYADRAEAEAAQHALQQQGTRAMITYTLPRARYWSDMFAE